MIPNECSNHFSIEEIRQHPNALSVHYQRFNVNDRILLTGHSHQAWPDCAFDGQVEAWNDAAHWVDKKWENSFQKADRVRQGFSRLIEDPEGSGHLALAPNTHDLLIRFLSALPLREKPRLITTDGEFHSIRRQLDRLSEEGIELIKTPTDPHHSLAERLIEAVDPRASAMLVSAVFFKSGRILNRIPDIAAACQDSGVPLLIDAYHAINVTPFTIHDLRLENAYIIGGGYKYCQLGEGNCFMRFPSEPVLRPLITGWFSEFDLLGNPEERGQVSYGRGGMRFAGSTYDPTSHYRAASVFDFFNLHGLTPAFLRQISQHQIATLINAFDNLDADPAIICRDRSVALEEIGGFLVLETPSAEKISRLLSEQGVYTDYRGDNLRLGPAPYLSDQQLQDAIGILGTVIKKS